MKYLGEDYGQKAWIESMDYYVRCMHCSAKNKLAMERIGLSPTCGKCKRQLFSEDSAVSKEAIIIVCQQCQTHNKVPASRIGAGPRWASAGPP